LKIKGISVGLKEKIFRHMEPNKRQFFEKVDNVFESVTNISGCLKPSMSKQEKK